MRNPGDEEVKLTDEELDFLATAYAENRVNVGATFKRPSTVNPLVKKLLDSGLIFEELQQGTDWTLGRKFFLARPSPKGLQVVKQYDPTEMVRAFIRTDHAAYAVMWIHFKLTLGELPEFLAHKEPKIRIAAKFQLERLVKCVES